MNLYSRSRFASIVVVLYGLLVSSQAVAGEAPPSATEILRQVQATYDAMRSYSGAGEVTSAFSPSGLAPQEMTHAFTIRLGRPELYRIEWEQRLPNFVMKGAVWSAGEGHFVVVPGQVNREQAKDVSTALAMATGISGGAASTIPGAFFALGHGPFKTLTDATLVRDEAIEGDQCYVISGRVAKQLGTTLWISKKSKLLRQMRHDYHGPMEMPEITDEDVKKSLESMNREPTDEAVAAMKGQLESAQKMMSRGMTGFSIELHRDIKVNPPLSKTDFAPTIAIEGQ